MMIYNNSRFWIRLLLVLIIPLSLSIYFIPSKPLQLDYIKEVNSNISEVYRLISHSVNVTYDPDSWRDNINKLFSVPFDLSYYHFCFEDINTTFINSEHVKSQNITWLVNVTFRNITENLVLGNLSYNCTKGSFFVDTRVYFDSVLNTAILMYPGSRHPESTAIIPNTTVYAKPNKKTLLIKRVIFMLSLWTVFLIMRELYKFVRGKNE